MVRIWNVHPKYLDDKRLLGEHNELHIIVGAIAKHYRGEKGGWQNHPETKRFYNKLGYLKKRHGMLTEEFGKRGWPSGRIHETALDFKGIPRRALSSDYRITKAMIEKDVSDLRKRWRKEKKKGGRVPIPAS